MLAVLAMAWTSTAPAAPAHTPYRGHHRRPPVSITPLPSSASSILLRGTLRVRVRSAHTTRLRLYALWLPGTGGPGAVITQTRTVRVPARHSRVFKLRVIAAARLALAAPCRGAIEARAVMLRGRTRRPGHSFAGRRRLTGKSAQCRRPGGAAGTSDLGGAFSPAQGGVNDPKYNPDQGLGTCDPIDPAVCLFPFPNDYYTVSDSTTGTGRRVSLNLTSMPTNKAGKPIDPTDINLQRRLQPRRADRRQGARARYPTGVR